MKIRLVLAALLFSSLSVIGAYGQRQPRSQPQHSYTQQYRPKRQAKHRHIVVQSRSQSHLKQRDREIQQRQGRR